MFDAILHTSDRGAMIQYLKENHPDRVEQDFEGEDVVMGLASTPPVIAEDGSRMIYARMEADGLEMWRTVDTVTVLGWAEFTGQGTGDAVYQMVWDDPEAKALYDHTYPRPEREVLTGDIEYVISVEEPTEVEYQVNEWGSVRTKTVQVEDSTTLTFFYGTELTTNQPGVTVSGPVNVTQTVRPPEKFGVILGA